MWACVRPRFRDTACACCDIASFDGVMLGSFVAQVSSIRFSDVGVSGACQGKIVVVGRRLDNVHDMWTTRLSTSKHSNTPWSRHTGVVFWGQLKSVNISFFQPCSSAVFYKYTCLVVSSYLTDHGWQLRNSPLRLDCCTQGLILFVQSHANRIPRQAYIRLIIAHMYNLAGFKGQ